MIPNRDILCCHGKLDPNKARDMKRIAKVDDFWLVFAILYCHNTPYPFRRAMTKLSRTHIAFSIQLRRRLMYVGSVSPRFFEVWDPSFCILFVRTILNLNRTPLRGAAPLPCQRLRLHLGYSRTLWRFLDIQKVVERYGRIVELDDTF